MKGNHYHQIVNIFIQIIFNQENRKAETAIISLCQRQRQTFFFFSKKLFLLSSQNKNININRKNMSTKTRLTTTAVEGIRLSKNIFLFFVFIFKNSFISHAKVKTFSFQICFRQMNEWMNKQMILMMAGMSECCCFYVLAKSSLGNLHFIYRIHFHTRTNS